MKQYSVPSPRIVQPGSQRRLSKLLILAVLLVMAAVVWWPQLKKVGPMPTPPAVVDHSALDAVQQQLTALQIEHDALRVRAINAERTNQVDQAALAAAQEALLALQDERAELLREVEFLKSLVSGDLTVLQLLDVKLWRSSPTESKVPVYGYSLALSKRAKGRGKVRGTLEISVEGKQAGQSVTLSMADLAIKAEDLLMGFSQFQTFTGELTLPVGFVPELIKVAVKPTGKQFRSYQKAIVWRLVEEKP
jgi:hypothetical protein